MYKILNYDGQMDYYMFKTIHPFYGAYLKLQHCFQSSDNCEVTIDETLFDNLKLTVTKFDELNLWFSKHGCYLTINHLFRSTYTQARLLKSGLAGKNSLHTKGLACDLTIWDIKSKSIITRSKLLYLVRDAHKELDFMLETVVYNNFFHMTVDSPISRKINPKKEFVISKLFTR